MNSEVIEPAPETPPQTQETELVSAAAPPPATPPNPPAPVQPPQSSAGFTIKPAARFTQKQKIIAAIVAGVLALAAVIVTVVIIVNNNNSQSGDNTSAITSTWGNAYYEYLIGAKADGNLADFGITPSADHGLRFIQVSGAVDPVMILERKEGKTTYAAVFSLADGGAVSAFYPSPSAVELLYYIPDKTYDYYVHVKEDEDIYLPVSEEVSASASPEAAEYKPADLLKPKDQGAASVTYNSDYSDANLQRAISEAVGNYKAKSQVITSSIKKDIKDQLAKLESGEDPASEEDQPDDASKDSSAAQPQAFKVGNYYLKYGKYKSSLDAGDWLGGTYTLNSDKTYVYENDYNYQGEQKHVKQTGTYQAVQPSGVNGEDSWMIEFTPKETDGDEEMKARGAQTWDVEEDNQFHAHQYLNIWTPTD